jgi:hypothetical protein
MAIEYTVRVFNATYMSFIGFKDENYIKKNNAFWTV